MNKLKQGAVAVVHFIEDCLYLGTFWLLDREFRWRYDRVRLLNRIGAPREVQLHAVNELDRYMKTRYFSRVAK